MKNPSKGSNAGINLLRPSVLSLLLLIPFFANAKDEIGLLVPDSNDSLTQGIWSPAVLEKKWNGVYCSGKQCILKPTSVNIIKGSMESDCGKKVSASMLQFKPAKPKFLVDRSLPSADIAQVEQNEVGNVVNDAFAKDRFGASVWTLTYKGGHYKVSLPEAYEQNTCAKKGKLPITVVLHDKLESKWERDICRLEEITGVDVPGEYAISWAGDIDGDGALDILIRLPSGGYSLLLSGSRDTEANSPLKNYRYIPVKDYCN